MSGWLDGAEAIRTSDVALCRLLRALVPLPYTAGIASGVQWAIRCARWK